MRTKSAQWNIWFILFIAFSLRFLLFFISCIQKGDFSNFYSPDTYSYLTMAKQLVAYGQFAVNGVPEIFLTPGYPVFLALGLLLKHVELVTLLLQISISCATVYLIYRIAVLMFHAEHIAKLCALLYAVEPLSILYSNELLVETIMAFLVILFLFFILKYIEKKTILDLFFASLAIAASVYVKIATYFLPLFLIAACILWIFWKKKEKTAALTICLFLCISYAFIGVWQVRNMVKAGYAAFSAIPDYNIYYYEAASVIAKKEGVSLIEGTGFYELQNKLFSDEVPAGFWDTIPGQVAWYRKIREAGINIISKDPFVYGKIYIRGFFVTLFEPGAVHYCKLMNLYPRYSGMSAEFSDKGALSTLIKFVKTWPLVFGVSACLGVLLLFYFACAVAGLIRKKWAGDLAAYVTLAVFMYLFFALRGGITGYSRYRHAFMAVLCIFAGYGVERLLDRYRHKTAK